MKKIFKLSLILIILFLGINASAQKRLDSGYSILSPGYSFSLINYKDDSATYNFNSHNISIGLLRFESSYKKFKFEGGASLQFISSRLNYSDLRNPQFGVKDARIAFFGMSPEIKIKYFPIFQESESNQNPSGAFVGIGAQFLLPIAKNNEVQINSLRPTINLGISKRKSFSIVIAPSFLKPSNNQINLTSAWYFGFDVDLFKF